jgi:flavin-dependent dehydrogenase
LVIGGGPAGSTIGALLAEKGWNVVLLEKDQHPRFHIGESLLPMNLPILERLGVLEAVREIGMIKHAAEFVSDTYDGRLKSFRFKDALDQRCPYAFEVRRSEFDHLLLKNSAAKGVIVHEGLRVRDVEFVPGGPSIVTAMDRENNVSQWETRFVVDASGRDTLLAQRLGWKKKNRKHNSAAIFGHFRNVIRRPGEDAGNITIHWFQHGWFWMIPLRDGTMSVGAVCWPDYLKTRDGPLEEFLWKTIRLSPGVYERMRDAELDGVARATGNYSYRSERLHREGCLLVGDAGAFIDPVFSSGVYLAMNSACLGAEAVDASLRDPASENRLMRDYERTIRRGLATFSWFIYRFTSPVMHRMFMHPTRKWQLQQAVISVLAGDIFAKTPLRRPLLIFKIIYYTYSLTNLRHVWSAYRNRSKGMRQKFSQETIMQEGD